MPQRNASKKTRKICRRHIRTKKPNISFNEKLNLKKKIESVLLILSTKLCIYDFNVKITLCATQLRGYSNVIDTFYDWNITISHNGIYIGEAEAINDSFSLEGLLLDMTNSPLNLKNILNWNDKKKNMFLNKNFTYLTISKNIRSFFEYIRKHNSLFKILSVNSSYCYSDNHFKSIGALCFDKVGVYNSDITMKNNNLDFLNLLHKMNIIIFDIKDMNEEEILEMYSLMSY